MTRRLITFARRIKGTFLFSPARSPENRNVPFFVATRLINFGCAAGLLACAALAGIWLWMDLDESTEFWARWQSPKGIPIILGLAAGLLIFLWYAYNCVRWLRYLRWKIRAIPYFEQEHRRRAGTCARCGYDLTGNTSGVCPECGLPVGQLALDCAALTKARVRPLTVLLALILLILLVVLIWPTMQG